MWMGRTHSYNLFHHNSTQPEIPLL